MNNLFTHWRLWFSRLAKALQITCLTIMQRVFAALPDPLEPTNPAAEGDYIGQWKGYAYDIGIVIVLIIGMIAFIVVAMNMITVYSDIGEGKKTWGTLGAHGAAGVLLLVFVIFLLTEASSIIFD